MGLLARAYSMPERPITVGWQLGIGHIVLMRRGQADGYQGIVVGAWLDGSIAVQVPDLATTITCTLEDFDVVGVMPRFEPEDDSEDV